LRKRSRTCHRRAQSASALTARSRAPIIGSNSSIRRVLWEAAKSHTFVSQHFLVWPPKPSDHLAPDSRPYWNPPIVKTETEPLEELLRSKSFLSWSPEPKPGKQPTISVGRGQSFTYQGKRYTNLAADEKHFSPDDLAKPWGVSAQTIRNVFKDEPDVLRLGSPSASKRSYVSLRIPQSVALRFHRRLSAIPT
jgi:hypothetical protein